jgi:hypothetical protein
MAIELESPIRPDDPLVFPILPITMASFPGVFVPQLRFGQRRVISPSHSQD